MNDDPIGKALDLQPLTKIERVDGKENVGADYDYARGNLISIIEKGQEALSGILDVAGMSQHPRSYEVVATLINSLTAANKDLLELSKKKKEIDGDSGHPTTVNNTLYVGSTAELQKLLKQDVSKE